MSAAIQIVSFVLVAFFWYQIGKQVGRRAGYEVGLSQGKAIGWLEKFEEEQQRLKAKHDRLGRFKGRGTP